MSDLSDKKATIMGEHSPNLLSDKADLISDLSDKKATITMVGGTFPKPFF